MTDDDRIPTFEDWWNGRLDDGATPEAQYEAELAWRAATIACKAAEYQRIRLDRKRTTVQPETVPASQQESSRTE